MSGIRRSLSAAAVLVAAAVPGLRAADAPPMWSVAVVDPAPEAIVAGVCTVRVRVDPPGTTPTHLAAGFWGAGWATLVNDGGSNEWSARLDSTLVPNGKARLLICGYGSGMANTRAGTEIAVNLRNPLNWYWGDIHCHGYYSDGVGFPADIMAHARKLAKLDFFCLTEHLEMLDDAEWADYQEQVHDANEDGVFVCFRGLEWTKEQGHGNIFEPSTYRWPLDREGFYKAAAEAGVIGMFNHPGMGDRVWNGLAYDEVGDRAMTLMEVRQDEELLAYIRALKAGWHVAAAGTDDAHSAHWGGGPWTVALAPGLSRTNILHALRERHVYSTTDRNCRFLFRVNRTLMGSVRQEPVDTVKVLVRVMDPDRDDPAAEIALYENGELVETAMPGKPRHAWRVTRTPAPGTHHYFVRVKQADGNVLTSAPVWITVKEPGA